MREESKQNYIIHIWLMKITWLYQLLNPNTFKLIGYNVFILGSILLILYLLIINLMYFTSIYYSRNNFTEVVKYISVLVATLFSMFKLCYLIRNSDALFKLMNFMLIHFLSHYSHQKSYLVRAREITIIISNIFTFSWIAIVIIWILSPIMINDNYINIKSNNGTYLQYRYNMLNLIFPVTTKFDNDDFFVFYLMESILIIIYGYVMIIFDFLIVSTCLTIIYQLKTILSSYRKLGFDFTSTDIKSKLY